MILKNFFRTFYFTVVSILFLINSHCDDPTKNENSLHKLEPSNENPIHKPQSSQRTVYDSIGKRAFHDVVVFHNAIYVIGGFEGVDESGNEIFRSDVLKSTNGTRWLQVKPNDDTAFSKRAFHTAVAFNSALYVIGGFDGTNTLNDVWKSSDGQNWKKIHTTGDFQARLGHTVLVVKNRMYMLGGYNTHTKKYYGPATKHGIKNDTSDTWVSSDGTNWQRLQNSKSIYLSKWVEKNKFNSDSNEYIVQRYLHATTLNPYEDTEDEKLGIKKNTILIYGGIAGGQVEDDLWQVTPSSHAETWTRFRKEFALDFANYEYNLWIDRLRRILSDTQKDNRMGHVLLTFKNRVYSIGGKNGDNEVTNDVYKLDYNHMSTQIYRWFLRRKKSNNEQGFEKRYGHKAVVFNDKVYVLGGMSRSSSIFLLKGIDGQKTATPHVFEDVWSSSDLATWTKVSPLTSP